MIDKIIESNIAQSRKENENKFTHPGALHRDYTAITIYYLSFFTVSRT